MVNAASTSEFFFWNVFTIFQSSNPKDPIEINLEEISLWYFEAFFLDMDENVPMVLTGVWVINFLLLNNFA